MRCASSLNEAAPWFLQSPTLPLPRLSAQALALPALPLTAFSLRTLLLAPAPPAPPQRRPFRFSSPLSLTSPRLQKGRTLLLALAPPALTQQRLLRHTPWLPYRKPRTPTPPQKDPNYPPPEETPQTFTDKVLTFRKDPLDLSPFTPDPHDSPTPAPTTTTTLPPSSSKGTKPTPPPGSPDQPSHTGSPPPSLRAEDYPALSFKETVGPRKSSTQAVPRGTADAFFALL